MPTTLEKLTAAVQKKLDDLKPGKYLAVAEAAEDPEQEDDSIAILNRDGSATNFSLQIGAFDHSAMVVQHYFDAKGELEAVEHHGRMIPLTGKYAPAQMANAAVTFIDKAATSTKH